MDRTSESVTPLEWRHVFGAIAAGAGVIALSSGLALHGDSEPTKTLAPIVSKSDIVNYSPVSDFPSMTERVPTLPSAKPELLVQPIEVLPDQPLPAYIRTGPTETNRVAITIDDIFLPEDADRMNVLLDLAEQTGARFTFFPTGGALEAHRAAGKQEVWQRVVAEGHEIGNHTFSHNTHITRLSSEDIRQEITRTQDALNSLLGFEYKMRLMRPPGGDGGLGRPNSRLMTLLQEMGYSMVMWDTDSNHTAGHESYRDKILGPTDQAAKAGSIVLTHFNTFHEGNFAPLVEQLVKNKGLQPTTVSGLFATQG